MDEYKMWSKIKEQDKYCVFCGRQVVGLWEADFSISKRKTATCWHKDCLKERNRKNKCLM